MPESNEYFTGTDATITLLTHPDDEWRGESVDCAFFQLTAGTSPIHIWNYARSEGTPAMSNAAQDAQIEELQSGTAGGAPFDDTAVSNMQASLQLLINEERFESTYYQFRSMSEIGNVKVEYDTQVDFESRSSTGYVMLDGRVSTVSRESSGRNATYPSVEITFRDVRPIGQTIALDTSEFAPSGRQRGGPGVSQELQSEGLGRQEGQKAFSASLYEGTDPDGKKVRPQFNNIPSSLGGFNSLELEAERTFSGTVERWIGGGYAAPVVVTESREQGRGVYLWQPGNEPRYKELTPTDQQYATLTTIANS